MSTESLNRTSEDVTEDPSYVVLKTRVNVDVLKAKNLMSKKLQKKNLDNELKRDFYNFFYMFVYL